MKKVLLGLSVFIIAAFMVVLVANAQTGTQEVKKSDTEVAKDCGKCPAASSCTKAEAVKKCDPANSKEQGCATGKCKEGMCDPAVCKNRTNKSQCAAKKCGSTS
jgi:hypothetical protein